VTDDILSLQHLCINIRKDKTHLAAVKDVSLTVGRGEIVGVVGESGCGKSVLVKSLLRLHDERKTKYGGEALLESRNLLNLTQREMGAVRGVEIGMIFQDPMISLNPIMKIGEQIAETLRARKGMSRRQAAGESLRLLGRVGVTPAEERYVQYPFELSGGILQRVTIAMAVALKPQILIADEATTALDVTTQAGILALMKQLKEESGMSLIVVTHDFGVVAELCDTVAVMYAGEIVEYGNVRQIFSQPMHPYTRALIESVPKSGGGGRRLRSIPGAPPPLYEKNTACAFAPRCSYTTERCHTRKPSMHSASGRHIYRCEERV